MSDEPTPETIAILAANHLSVTDAIAFFALEDVVNVNEGKLRTMVEEREANGPFENLEQLEQRVKGIAEVLGRRLILAAARRWKREAAPGTLVESLRAGLFPARAETPADGEGEENTEVITIVDVEEEPAAVTTEEPLEIGPIPRYRFVEPEAQRSEDPEEIEEGALRRFASYRARDPEALAITRSSGDEALLALHANGIAISEGPERGEAAAVITATFLAVLEAASSFAIVDASGVVLALAPGDLPEPLIAALTQHLLQLEFQDVVNYPFMRMAAQLLGAPEPVLDELDLGGEVAMLETIIEVDPSLRKLPGFADIAGRVKSKKPFTPLLLEPKKRAVYDKEGAKTILIPDEYRFEPPEGEKITPVDEELRYDYPIALVLSDLHMSQERLGELADGAEDGADSEEATFVTAISKGWKVRVDAHRKLRGTSQPAYLFLNGDIFDFWAADLVGGPRNSILADVAVSGPAAGLREVSVTRSTAFGRMLRIVLANKAFVDAVHNWVDAHPLNFCVYIGGNHDDHLERFKIGAPMAKIFHPERCAYVAKQLAFEQLSTLLEHGHRVDEFNSITQKMGLLSSLGEVMVSLAVNPMERGGISTVPKLVDQSGDVPGLGFSDEQLSKITTTYRKIKRIHDVDPSIWPWMATLDNMTNEGAYGVIADQVSAYLAREIEGLPNGKRKKAAELAKVKELSGHVKELLGIWLSNDAQSLSKKFLGKLVKLPTVVTSFLYTFARSKPQAKSLQFNMKTGYKGFKVMVAGHTHQPGDTTPPITDAQVPAQIFNTGTGENMYDVKKGTTPDVPPFVPVPRDNACILLTVRANERFAVEVRVAEYRSLQGKDPRRGSNLEGYLREGKRNVVVLD